MRIPTIPFRPLLPAAAVSLGAVLLLGACTAAPGNTGPAETASQTLPGESAVAASPPAMSPAMSPAASPAAGTPAPTALQIFPITLLPNASLDPSAVQVACEEATEAGAVSCDEAVELVGRLAPMAAAGPVTNIQVDRPEGQPGVVTLTWLSSDEDVPVAFTATIDTVNGTVSIPAVSDATFPPA